MDIKLTFKSCDQIPIPIIKKFSCEVDQMLFDFKEMKGTSILIQKISPNNYIFGTKKIYAKVCNGLLLVRVGGGFMDIDIFFSTYGGGELVKQEREEAKKLKEANPTDEVASRKQATYL